MRYEYLNVAMPVGFWICVLGIALLRFVCYGIRFYKYHTFVALHTYANKITGVFLFMAPVIYSVCGLTVMSVTLSGMAFAKDNCGQTAESAIWPH